MRIFSFIVCFIVCFFAMHAQKDYSVQFSQPKQDCYQLSFNVNKWNIETVEHNGAKYNRLLFSKSTVTDKLGFAELPFISSSVLLPEQKNVDIKIISAEYQDFHLSFPLLPSRGIIYRSQAPDNLPYKIASESLVDEFYPHEDATLEKPFIIRDERGTTVRVYPFKWNALTQTLRVYSNITVELTENDKPAINPLIRRNIKPVKEAIGLYQSMFINYTPMRYDLTMTEHGDILVITTERDEEAIEPYIKWKKEKGFDVFKRVVDKDTHVKSIIQEEYDTNEKLMYVLLVGDWDDLKCDLELVEGDYGPTDPMLGCVAGDDIYPDIAIGRFSANNPEQVKIQVDKTINYEKNPNMDPDWLETFIGIGSNEGPGDDYERDFQHVQRIYSQRLASFTYKYHKENYGLNPSVLTLASSVNEGASTIAYCGHGNYTRFVTTGYNNSSVNSTTNGDKIPFIVAVACYTGGYHTAGDCFGEAWLRKKDGGALVTWMSSVMQPWTPPQRGQDYFYDLLIGGFDYDKYADQEGINTTEQRTHWGSLTVNSICLMLEESSLKGDSITVKTWITLGDPSVQLRTKTPDEITSSVEKVYKDRKFETVITHKGIPIKNALVTISQNNVYKKAFTDLNGKVSIDHPFEAGEVLLVVTGFNTTTIYKNIECEIIDGPVVIYDDVEVNDDNKQLDYYDGKAKLNFSMKNIGISDATNVTVKLTTEDPYISIIKDSDVFPAVSIDKNTVVENAFEIEVDPEIPDQHYITFDLVATQDNKSWESKFNMKAHAAEIMMDETTIIDDIKGDNNGILEAGEIAKISFKIKNSGSTKARNIRGALESEGEGIVVGTRVPQLFTEELLPGETAEAFFILQEEGNKNNGYSTGLALFVVDEVRSPVIFPIQINIPKLYCTPSGNCSEGDGIRGFKLGRINNLNSGCSGGYSDFTSKNTPLSAGNTFDVTVVTSVENQKMSLWIDFDNDGKFSSSERLVSFHDLSVGENIVPITIPSSVQQVEACRMRVMVGRGTSFYNDPCSDLQYGETEDYTVKIVSTVTFPEPVNPSGNQADRKITLKWKAPQDAVPSSYKICRNGMWLDDLIQSTEFTEEVAEYGTYIYLIKSVYYNGESKASQPVVVETAMTPAEIDVVADNECNITVSWESIPYTIGYNIYRTDKAEKLNAELLTDPIYMEALPSNDDFYYQIGVVYAENSEILSQRVKANCSMVGIDKLNVENDIKIYPNPVEDVLYVNCGERILNIQIIDMTGKEIYQQNIPANSAEINIPQIGIKEGLYLIKVKTANHIYSEKIIVSK